MELTKKYRLVWDDNKNIILNDEFVNSRTYTNRNSFESQFKYEVDAKIIEFGLKQPENMET